MVDLNVAWRLKMFGRVFGDAVWRLKFGSGWRRSGKAVGLRSLRHVICRRRWRRKEVCGLLALQFLDLQILADAFADQREGWKQERPSPSESAGKPKCDKQSGDDKPQAGKETSRRFFDARRFFVVTPALAVSGQFFFGRHNWQLACHRLWHQADICTTSSAKLL